MSKVLFISDLHLEEDRPETLDVFLAFLRNIPTPGDTLYILGDLFDVWLGDDLIHLPFNQRVVDALCALSEQKVDIHILCGNRDFLLGDVFATCTKAILRPEPLCIDLQGVPTLLLHGDVLCTDDIDYQQFRNQVRGDVWQKTFLNLPVDDRRNYARTLRKDSDLSKAVKIASIMDATEETVEQQFSTYRVQWMIHGHTHRPVVHEHRLANRVCYRWVLPSWDRTPGYLLSVVGEFPSLQYLT